MYGDYSPQTFAIESRSVALDKIFAAVIQQRRNKQILIRRLTSQCPHADGTIQVCIARGAYAAKAVATTAAGALTLSITADDDGYIGGHQVTSSDFLLIATDNEVNTKGVSNGWRLLSISGHAEDAGNDELDLTVAGLDNITGIESIVTAGAKCYIIRAVDILNLAVGAATVEKEYWAAGEVDAPVAIKSDPGSASAASFNVLAEYVGTLS